MTITEYVSTVADLFNDKRIVNKVYFFSKNHRKKDNEALDIK